MHFEKVSLNEFLTLVALVDEDHRVIAAGVFNSDEDAQTAIGFSQAVLFNTGTAHPIDDTDFSTQPPKREDLPTLDDVLRKLTDHARQLKRQVTE